MTSPLLRWPIAEIEYSDLAPTKENLPGCPWPALGFPRGEKYGPAFDVKTNDDADLYLLMLVGHTLRFHYFATEQGFKRPGTWREAFAMERAELAWYAFAKDVGREGVYSSVTAPDGRIIKIENTVCRDFVWDFYKATMPDLSAKKLDILERVEQKREKEAKKKGVNYQRDRRPIQDRLGYTSPTPKHPFSQGDLWEEKGGIH